MKFTIIIISLASVLFGCRFHGRTPLEFRVKDATPDIIVIVHMDGIGDSLIKESGRFIITPNSNGVVSSSTHPGYGSAKDFINRNGTLEVARCIGNGKRTFNHGDYEYWIYEMSPVEMTEKSFNELMNQVDNHVDFEIGQMK